MEYVPNNGIDDVKHNNNDADADDMEFTIMQKKWLRTTPIDNYLQISSLICLRIVTTKKHFCSVYKTVIVMLVNMWQNDEQTVIVFNYFLLILPLPHFESSFCIVWYQKYYFYSSKRKKTVKIKIENEDVEQAEWMTQWKRMRKELLNEKKEEPERVSAWEPELIASML